MNEILVEYENLGLNALENIERVYGNPIQVCSANGSLQKTYITKAGAILQFFQSEKELTDISIKGLEGVIIVCETKLDLDGVKLTRK